MATAAAGESATTDAEEELALFDDVELDLFNSAGAQPGTAGDSNTKQKQAARQMQHQVVQVPTAAGSGSGSIPTVGLMFGEEAAPFELWLPCPTLRAGSCEVLYAAADAQRRGAECIVTRRAAKG